MTLLSVFMETLKSNTLYPHLITRSKLQYLISIHTFSLTYIQSHVTGAALLKTYSSQLSLCKNNFI